MPVRESLHLSTSVIKTISITKSRFVISGSYRIIYTPLPPLAWTRYKTKTTPIIPSTSANCAPSLSDSAPPLSDAVAEDTADASDATVPAVVLALMMGILEEEPDIEVSV